MNNKVNECLLTLKRLINKLQNFWKLHIFWNILHKPWHNNVFKIIKSFEFFLKTFKEYSIKSPFKEIPKVGECNLCYPICTLVWTMKFSS
jgi:hypothetical protein